MATDLNMPGVGQSIFGRSTPMTGSALRLQWTGKALAAWLALPPNAPGAVVIEGDSTGWSPGTVSGGALGGGGGGYLRFVDRAAQLIAARPEAVAGNIGVRLWVNDFANLPNQGAVAFAIAAGDSSIRTNVPFTSGQAIRLDAYGNAGETVTAASNSTGSGTYTTALTGATQFAHAVAAPATGPGGPGDFTQSTWQAPRDLRTSTAGLPSVVLPGGSGLCPYIPAAGANKIVGTRWFFGALIAPTSWTTAQTLLTKGLGSGSYGMRLMLNADGTLSFRWSTTGSDSNTVTSTAATTPPAGGAPLYVGVDVDTVAHTATFLVGSYRFGWTVLGTVVTNASLTTIYDPGSPWYFGSLLANGGGGSYFGGNVYEILVLRGGRYGTTVLPIFPHDWHADVTLDWTGGGLLEVYNSSWPGRGLDEFDDPRYHELLNPQAATLLWVLNTGHNDFLYNGPKLIRKLDRVVGRVARRHPRAELAVTTQNPTLRSDGPTADPTLPRYQHRNRVAQTVAWAISRGLHIANTSQAFTDYVLGCASSRRAPTAKKPDGTTNGDGTLTDLLDPNGTTGLLHPAGAGVELQANAFVDATVIP